MATEAGEGGRLRSLLHRGYKIAMVCIRHEVVDRLGRGRHVLKCNHALSCASSLLLVDTVL